MTGFGFKAVLGHYDYGPGWTVMLPHQCEDWRIATDVDAATAIQRLDEFIAEAIATRDSIAGQAS